MSQQKATNRFLIVVIRANGDTTSDGCIHQGFQAADDAAFALARGYQKIYEKAGLYNRPSYEGYDICINGNTVASIIITEIKHAA